MKRTERTILGNMGSIYVSLGRHYEAISHYQKALLIQKNIGNKRGEAITLGNLGATYQSLFQFEESISYYNQSLEISRNIGDKRGEGIDLGNLGWSYLRLEKFKEAEACLNEAINICKEVCPPAAGAFYGSMGLLQATQGNIEEASKCIELGEPLISLMPPEYGKFLCKKIRILHMNNQQKRLKRLYFKPVKMDLHLLKIH